MVAEAIDYFGIREDLIAVSPVGCAVFLYNYFNMDVVEAPHGRAPAVATGIRRALPDKPILVYQGDGDMAGIGTSEIIHCANRGENVTVIFINNTTYGMTGGQMAPTTLLGQKTTTTPYGRDFRRDGYPIRITEMIAVLDAPAFVARVAVDKVSNIRKAKRIIRQAFETQVKGLGFSLVEVLSPCPTDWGMTPQQARERIEKEIIPYFPLGILKEKKEMDHY
jgi:2-oxoglutarate ferredoxin oxidoreductase subunit beta